MNVSTKIFSNAMVCSNVKSYNNSWIPTLVKTKLYKMEKDSIELIANLSRWPKQKSARCSYEV